MAKPAAGGGHRAILPLGGHPEVGGGPLEPAVESPQLTARHEHGAQQLHVHPAEAPAEQASCQDEVVRSTLLTVRIITSTMSPPPPWEAVLEAAARLQELVPDAVLVGGSAAAHHAGHRVSFDDDHVVTDLRQRFDRILQALEETDGWVTARVRRPVLILGSLDGVETGVRNLIRRRPLEVEEIAVGSRKVRVPTLEEIARIKAWLCLMRNATRDYLDFAALADRLGPEAAADVVLSMDDYYADQQGAGGRRIAAQVAKQLAEPLPADLDRIDLRFYRRLDRRWQDWGAVADACKRIAVRVLERAAEARDAEEAR